MLRSEICYAKAGEHHIAYRELIGDAGGGRDIVAATSFFMPMETLSEDPMADRLLTGLAGLGRLVVFDRRGIGLSDPITDWEMPLWEQWADDLASVIVAAGCDAPAVFSWGPAPVARGCAVRHPGLIDRLVLFNPGSPFTDADAEWVSEVAERARVLQSGIDEEPDFDRGFPNRWHDPEFRRWFNAAGQSGASPRQAERLTQKMISDPPLDNAQVATPTLVITRVPANSLAPVEYFAQAAWQIPDAQHVALPAGDGFPIGAGVDDVLAEISRFVTGEVRLPPPERQVAVILFTDLVGSTRRAEAAGDAAWKRLLDRHDAVNRIAVTRRGGEIIKTTGDGVLALLPSATAAIDAARAIRAELRDDDLQVRIGIHLGEVDRRGADVSGLAVNIAARLMSSAEPDQILASVVVALTTDAATFASIGMRTLKGVSESWELFTAD